MDEQLHHRIAELLSAYIDGEVTADERLLVEAHLGDCPRCVQDLEALRQTVSWVRALPPVAAPRPLTLRLEDVGLAPIEAPQRRSWWPMVAAPAWAGVAAVLVCGLVAGGGLLLNRATPVQIAHQPNAAATAVADSAMTGKVAAPAPVAVEESAGEPDEPVAVEADLTTSAGDEADSTQDVEAEFAAAAVPADESPGEAGAPEAARMGQPDDLAAGEAGAAQVADLAAMTATPPAATPAPTQQMAFAAEEPGAVEEPALAEGAVQKEMAAAAPAPVEALVLEVNSLMLQIEPGLIVITGTLPLDKGVRLSASLWRDDQPVAWAMPESDQSVVGDKGDFSLRLAALPGTPDFDLFAAEPAEYEIRLAPEETEFPMEARITFDTYIPPSP